MLHRARLSVPSTGEPFPGSLRALRRQGIALLSRQRREQELADEAASRVAAARAIAAEKEERVAETEQQLKDGCIYPDGTPISAAKRKRMSDAGAQSAGGDKPPPKKGRPPKDKDGESGGAGGPKDKKGAAAREESTAPPASAAKPKAPKRKSVGAAPSFLIEGGLVEVSLRLGEAFASWYQCKLLEAAKGSKWRVALQRHGEGLHDEREPLLLQGRPAAELVTTQMLRPIPMHDLQLEWAPVASEHCELLYEDGWWRVRVMEQARDGSGGWTVVYTPANAVHTVPRARLRPMFNWDAEGQTYAPIKISNRR